MPISKILYPSIQVLLLASIWGYERVHFDGVPLPFVFELIAWISMAGPLLVVPGVALWYVIEVLRRNKVLVQKPICVDSLQIGSR
jgi:hypothetical protein